MSARATLPALPGHQRGVVLFIALIVMVALSLAGVALVRSVDTTTSVVGNLAFRQAALLPANLAVEEASRALFKDAAIDGVAKIPDKTKDQSDESYFASRQAGEDVRGVPKLLQKKANYTLPKVLDAGNGNEVRYVIERICTAPGPAVIGNCDMMPPKQGVGTTIGDTAPPSLPQVPFYRVSVRVDGPQNTVTFLQAMLR